nr:TlpA disulfide reductase family protein [uncultured Gellertiella sp.]
MTSKKPYGLPSHLLIGLAAGAGILAGVAAVYVMGMGSGNGSGAAASATVECAIPQAQKAAIAAAARGGVAAMTPLDTPRHLDDLAFSGPEGKALTLGGFRGKTVLMNLWATWCFPCREEMPALDRLQGKSGSDRFEVVAVNIDTGSDEKPRAFLKETGIAHLTPYRDNTLGVFNALKKQGLALGLPVTLLVDPRGCVLAAMNGPAPWDGADAAALIEAVK